MYLSTTIYVDNGSVSLALVLPILTSSLTTDVPTHAALQDILKPNATPTRRTLGSDSSITSAFSLFFHIYIFSPPSSLLILTTCNEGVFYSVYLFTILYSYYVQRRHLNPVFLCLDSVRLLQHDSLSGSTVTSRYHGE
ncbi:hypothetical protein BDQ17DRAFT_629250 [Cyathus striatus]|nr:hypothetical protein BDQ17DRAFT_629250 [Cyathus striatus]